MKAAVKRELAQCGFSEAVFGRKRLYLASEIAAHAQAVMEHLYSTDAGGEQAAGNRRSAIPLTIAELPPMYARRCRRGGLMRLLVAELYAGAVPRPLRELLISAAARRRGLPIADPMGAMIERAGPLLYRGWFLTGALEGVTLWDLLLGEGDGALRKEALEQARISIDRLHQGGLYHADLNFHNLFVCMQKRPVRVVVLDLDKARLDPFSLPPSSRQANFDRLARSARRLAQAGAILTASERAVLGIAA